MDADFGFAGIFWTTEASLSLTLFRAYDADLGRWLSRDPLKNAEVREGANLYAYVANNPVNMVDPLGLEGCCPLSTAKFYKDLVKRNKEDTENYCKEEYIKAGLRVIIDLFSDTDVGKCDSDITNARIFCGIYAGASISTLEDYIQCLEHPCRTCKGKCGGGPGRNR